MAFGVPFKAYKVLTFDIYGTLIDWESGIFHQLRPLLQRLPETHPRRDAAELYQREFLLGIYKTLEPKIQHENPKLAYPEVLARVYENLATDFLKVPFTPEEAAAFGASVGTWPAFLDTIDAMVLLGKYYKLIALSNVDKSSLASTLASPLQSRVKFDAVYTAEEIGSYKPDLANFEYLIEHVEKDFGAAKNEILHVAQSLTHDHVPAKAIGLSPGVWIERGGGAAVLGGDQAKLEQQGKVQLGAQFGTLGELAREVEWYFEEYLKR